MASRWSETRALIVLLRRTLPPSMDDPNSSMEEEEDARKVRSREERRSSEAGYSSRFDSREWEKVVGFAVVPLGEGERRVEVDARWIKEASSWKSS
jgi:hypothetical protein